MLVLQLPLHGKSQTGGWNPFKGGQWLKLQLNAMDLLVTDATGSKTLPFHVFLLYPLYFLYLKGLIDETTNRK